VLEIVDDGLLVLDLALESEQLCSEGQDGSVQLFDFFYVFVEGLGVYVFEFRHYILSRSHLLGLSLLDNVQTGDFVSQLSDL
jgi:hypothetical protein